MSVSMAPSLRPVLCDVSVALLLCLAPSYARADGPALPRGSGNTYQTAIVWNNSPADAAKQAAREAKLLMVMHLSGNFAKTEFT